MTPEEVNNAANVFRHLEFIRGLRLISWLAIADMIAALLMFGLFFYVKFIQGVITTDFIVIGLELTSTALIANILVFISRYIAEIDDKGFLSFAMLLRVLALVAVIALISVVAAYFIK